MYNLLIVDDEPLILEDLSGIAANKELSLRLAGLAHNGLEAMAIIEREDVDILLTDIRMPKMNGLELLERVREHSGQRVKCIMLSGYDDFEFIRKAAQLGIEDYLLKPAGDEALIQALIGAIRKLDKERALDLILSEGRNVLSENLMNQWIRGEIERTELKLRAELIGLPMITRRCLLCALRMPQRTSAQLELRQVLRDEMKQLTGSRMVFFDPDDDLFVMMVDDAAEAFASEDGRLDACRQALSKRFGVSLFAVMGELMGASDPIEEQYQLIKQWLNHCLLLGYNHTLLMPEAEHVPPCAPSEELFVGQVELSDAIRRRDAAKVHSLLADLLHEERWTSQGSPSQVLGAAAQLLFVMFSAIQVVCPAAYARSMDLWALLMNISKCATMDELRQQLVQAGDAAIALLESERSNVSSIVNRVTDYVDNHYHENINIKTLAAKFHVNPFYLGQLFKKENGQSFTDYLNNVRIEEAKLLLLSGNYRANEVAEKVGYLNTNYFFTRFKRSTGVSPSEYIPV